MDVVLVGELPPQRLLVFLQLPIHAKNKLAWPYEPFRFVVALQTPLHL